MHYEYNHKGAGFHALQLHSFQLSSPKSMTMLLESKDEVEERVGFGFVRSNVAHALRADYPRC